MPIVLAAHVPTGRIAHDLVGAIAMMVFSAAVFAGRPDFGTFTDAGGIAAGLGKYVSPISATLVLLPGAPLGLVPNRIAGATRIWMLVLRAYLILAVGMVMVRLIELALPSASGG